MTPVKNIVNWVRSVKDAFRRGLFPPEFSFFLHLPWRYIVLSPQQLVHRLALSTTHQVLEVGVGSGFYSLDVAHKLTHGHLELLDIQPAMLAKIRQKIDAAGLNNVGYTLANAGRLPFADSSFDVLFLVTVLGELSDPTTFLHEAHRVLRPGGLLSISEHWPDPDFASIDKIRPGVEQAGFTFVRQFGGRFNYTANFQKR